jgi:type IV pilus assembly protein PilM
MTNRFDNLFKTFLKTEKSVLGVDIGSSSIKVVQVRRKQGKAILETYGELSLGPYADKGIGTATKLDSNVLIEALNDVLKEANVTTTNSAISIPMKESLVTVIKMPRMQERQLAQMIPIEARKYIPVPISEVTLDWFVVPKMDFEFDDEGVPEGQHKIPQAEVLVVAIHNDVLQSYSSIVNNAKLNATFFEIEMFSTVRAVIESGDTSPVMIFDLGAGATKIYIVERGIIRDSHVINKGSQEITMNISRSMGVSIDFAEKMKRNYGRNTREQDEQIRQIIDLVFYPVLSETNAVLINFQKRYNKNISKVILVGGGVMLSGLEKMAQERLSLPVVYGKPFDKLETPAFLEEVLDETGLAFSTAIGLALRKIQEFD